MKTSTLVSVFLLLVTVTLAWQGETVRGEVLVIEGPTGSDSSVEGTFRVTLDHSLTWDPYDCFFDNVLVNLPIVGDGFVVSNVQTPLRDSAGVFYNDDDMPVVFWQRDFHKESEISGEIFSFDVHFEDGITEGSYTIGQQEVSSGWNATCYDGDTPIIAVDGIYFDNWGGRTFSVPEPATIWMIIAALPLAWVAIRRRFIKPAVT